MKVLILNISFLIPLSITAENLTKKYIAENLPYAVEASERYGVPISICLGQAILESASGTSKLAKKNKNHFGMVNGATAKQPGKKYRIYDTTAESFRDWAKNIAEYYPYASLFGIPATNFRKWAHGLQKAGYSVSGNYALVLSKVIEKYNLDVLDKPFFIPWCHEKIFAFNC